jgi:hypothetical protein
MELYAGLAITTLIGSGIGAFVGAYLRKKGENLATHEDIDKLVTQVSAVTTATKEIESKITSDVWDRQKKWELKREVLFETARKVAQVKDALTSLHAVYKTDQQMINKGHAARVDERIKVGAVWIDAADELDQAASLVALVCGQGVQKALLGFGLFTRQLAQTIIEGRPETLESSVKELVTKSEAISSITRRCNKRHGTFVYELTRPGRVIRASAFDLSGAPPPPAADEGT